VLHNFIKYFEAKKDLFPKFPYTKIPVFIDVDPNDHRTGVLPKEPLGVELAKAILNCSFLHLYGVYVHGGSSYQSINAEQIESSSERERDSVLNLVENLVSSGAITDEYRKTLVVATGSTPTSSLPAKNMNGINEFHPGNYILNDAHQYSIGVCGVESCAQTIFATVISQYRTPIPRLLIDAGAFALSKDKGPSHISYPGSNSNDTYNSYGVVAGHYPRLIVSTVSQELGSIIENPSLPKSSESTLLSQFPVGSKVNIIPNHSCMSSYCYEYLYIIDNNNNVLDKWRTCPRHSTH